MCAHCWATRYSRSPATRCCACRCRAWPRIADAPPTTPLQRLELGTLGAPATHTLLQRPTLGPD
eukprot:6877673-Prymnesium_polylepis.1